MTVTFIDFWDCTPLKEYIPCTVYWLTTIKSKRPKSWCFRIVQWTYVLWNTCLSSTLTLRQNEMENDFFKSFKQPHPKKQQKKKPKALTAQDCVYYLISWKEQKCNYIYKPLSLLTLKSTEKVCVWNSQVFLFFFLTPMEQETCFNSQTQTAVDLHQIHIPSL